MSSNQGALAQRVRAALSKAVKEMMSKDTEVTALDN